MVRFARRLTLAASLALLAAGPAAAQLPPGCYGPPAVVAPAPAVSYYAAPAVSYYAPSVSYYAAPAVSYYAAPAVAYYPPAVSYYAAPAATYAAPGAVTTTRYGLFGRPRYTTTYYYP